jgi:hypothetical protein
MPIGTPTLIGTQFVANSNANQQISLTGGASVGDTVIVSVANDGGGLPTGVTDSKGNTYVADTAGLHNADDFSVRVFSSRITTALVAGDTLTVAHGTAGTWDRMLAVTRVPGLLTTTGWVDKTASAQGTGTAWNSGATTATAQANELVFGVAAAGGAAANSTQAAGLTELTDVFGASSWIDMTVVYKIVSATGAQSVSGTWNLGDAWGAICITYKEAGEADSTPPITNVTSGTFKMSDESGKDSYAWSFQANENCQAWEVRVVADAGDARGVGTLVESGGAINANTTVSGSLTYAELNAAGQGSDGEKILKFFAQDTAGNWST